MPGSVELETNMTFQNCSNLETIILKKGISNIKSEAFYGCTNLKYIALPSTLTTIEPLAFCKTGIEFMIIPESVTNVGDSIFYNCSKSPIVYCEALKTETDSKWSSDWDIITRPPNEKRVEEIQWGYSE